MSNKLAHYLRYLGVAQGDMVPIAFPKSSWTIVLLCSVRSRPALPLPCSTLTTR